MLLNTKMELHNTPTSKLAEMKAISPNGHNKYTARDIYNMIEFLVDNICVRQTVGIPMATNCAPLLADLFLYFYEKEYLNRLIKEGKRKLARKFNLSYLYIFILMTLSLSIIKDLMNSSLISSQKDSPFLRPQNLLWLLLISTSFLLELRTTTLPSNYMTNMIRLVSTL